MKIRDLNSQPEAVQHQLADLLMAGFADSAPTAWTTFNDALDEVKRGLDPERISLIALEDDRVVGWVGAIRQYNGYVYEIHPLVVHNEYRKAGVGTNLMVSIESRVMEAGGLTLLVGSDDETNRTSLAGIDLYPNPLEALSNIENLDNHPYEFYLRLGFSLVGVVPDANGFGKPDILLAKRIRNPK